MPDAIDACPDVAGVKTSETATNGCPNNPWGAPAGAADRDNDRVPDSIDACPDVVGVASSDPKTTGCPAGKVGVAPVIKPVALQPAAKVVTPPPVVATPPPTGATPAAAPAPAAVASPPPPVKTSTWYKPWTWFD